MKPGIYNELSIEDYHAADGISNSSLGLLAKNPLKFKSPGPRKESDIFNVGSAAHKALLEGKDFWKDIAVAPHSVLSKTGTRVGTAYTEWAETKGKGRTILTQDQGDQVQNMVQSVLERPEHKTAQSIISYPGAIFEQSIFYNDPENGCLCKVRPDIRIPTLKALIDIKTCIDASPDGFSKAIANFNYDRHAAIYLDVVSAHTGDCYKAFLFIAVEKEPPHSVAVYRLSQEAIEIGRQKYRWLLDLYAECKASDNWPSYPDEVCEISLPYWAVRQAEFN